MTVLAGWEFLREFSATQDRMNQVQTSFGYSLTIVREGGINRLPVSKKLTVLR